jgi:hypothetical protein
MERSISAAVAALLSGCFFNMSTLRQGGRELIKKGREILPRDPFYLSQFYY